MTLLALAGCPKSPEAPEARRDSASCPPELLLSLGACVSPRVASAICGPNAVAAPSGCVMRAPCERGRARDLATGECLARRDVRAVGTSLGMLIADDEVLACPAGAELAFASADARGGPPRLACMAAQAPSSPAPCAVGTIAMPARGCVRVVDGAKVDVVGWLQAVVGAEGAAGAAPLCEALARRAAALSGIPSPDARLFVALSFPDNDVTQVAADVRVIAASGAPDAAATAELDAAVGPLVEALRGLGGTASQASVTSTVECKRALALTAPTPTENENDVRR